MLNVVYFGHEFVVVWQQCRLADRLEWGFDMVSLKLVITDAKENYELQ